MSFSVIHFSDIHIQTASDLILNRVDRIKQACVSALPGEGIVAIAISGDIAYSGKDGQYALAKAMIDEIKEYIEAQTKSSVVVVSVPGNHDCDFDKDNSIRKTLISSPKPESIDNTYYSGALCVQEEYRNFAKSYNMDKDHVLPYKEIAVGEDRILFLLSNTAWMSAIHETPGTLVMPCPLFEEIKPCEYKIVFYMLHHPSSWWNPDYKMAFIDHIRKNADMVLLGHEHCRDKYQQTGESFSVFCNHGKELQNTENDESAFSIICFDNSFQNYKLIDFVWENGLYRRSSETNNQYHKNTSSLQTVFYPNEDTINGANDLGIAVNHFSKEDVSLTDLFVWPDLNKVDFKNERMKTIRVGLPNEITDNNVTIIVGAPVSGKTALAKMLFLQEKYSNTSCILLNGSQFHPSSESKIQQTIENVFATQYSPDLIEEFRQLPKEKKAVIVDDFDQINFKRRELIFNYLCIHFDHVVLLISSGIEITSVFPTQALRDEDSWFYYELLPLGNKKRYELICKWYNLGADDLPEDVLNDRIEKGRAQIDTLLGNGAAFIPAMPIFLIGALQNIDATQNNLAGSKYGQLYESLILSNLSKVSPDYIASGAFNIDSTVLSHMAYQMLSNKIAHFNEAELAANVQSVSEEYLLPISTKELLEKMTTANIICKDNSQGEVYKFKYPYIFYYFAGKYIAFHAGETDVKGILAHMSEKLYIETYGNVIVFVCHFANNRDIIDDVLLSAYGTLESYSEFDFVKENLVFEKIQDVIDTLVPKQIGGNETIDRNRSRALVELDKAGINDGIASEGENVIDDIDEDLSDKEKDIISIVSALKTIEVLGEILKNYPGEIKGTDKIDIITEIHKLGMRSVQAIISTMGYLEQALVEFAMERAEKQVKRYSKDEIVLATRHFVGILISSMARGMIHQIASSIDSPYLLSAAEKTFENDPSISSKLILLDLKLNCLKKVNFAEIKHLKKEFDDSNEKFASRILDSIVGQYLSFNRCDYSLRSRLCSLCGFSERETLKASQQELLS